ncbi:hypothetical protein TruAng_008476 [Truncatella angustata]|nr:hypothetical protein TruAng_008476 [Truncatella angustata]
MEATLAIYSSDEGEEVGDVNTAAPSEGTMETIATHEATVAIMDFARRYVNNENIVNTAVRGDLAQLRHLVQRNVDINVQDGLQETALFAAVCHQHVDAVELLLQAGANPNLTCSNSWKALHAVSRSGNEGIARLLLRHGANTEARDSVGWVPLHVASLYGNENIVAVLLEHHSNPNARAADQSTPLHIAADFGHEAVIRRLVQHGADLGAQCTVGNTPLHVAAMPRPFPTQVCLFVELGSNPNIANRVGNTPLHLAVRSGFNAEEAVIPLLRHGADANIKNGYGWTPLLLAISQRNNSDHFLDETATAIIEEPATDVNSVSALLQGETTPLVLAIESRNVKAVELLLRRGATFRHTVDRNGTPVGPVFLAAAVCSGPAEAEIMNLLLERGANPNEEVGAGISAVHVAALNGNAACLRLLLKRRAGTDPGNVNHADAHGSTPMHVAAREQQPECIEVLLEHCADVNAKDVSKATPLHMAARTANEQSIRLLMAAGADVQTTEIYELKTPLDIVRDMYHETSDLYLKSDYLTLLSVMIEKLAERDPQARQLVEGEMHEGWYGAQLSRLTQLIDDGTRPRGAGLAVLRQRYYPVSIGIMRV